MWEILEKWIHTRGLHGYGPGPRPVPSPARRPEDDRWFFKQAGRVWQIRGGFPHGPSRAGKWKMIFPMGWACKGEMSWPGYKKSITKNIVRQLGPTNLLLLLLLLTKCASQSLSSLIFSLIGLTYTIYDKLWMLIFRWKVVLNKCSVL